MSESSVVKKVEIAGLSCNGLSRITFHRGDIYAKVMVDGRMAGQTSYVARSKNPKWDNAILFTVSDGVSVNVQVYQRRSVGEDHLIGELEVPFELSTLVEASNDIQQKLMKKKKEMRLEKGTVQFKIRKIMEDILSTADENIPAPSETLKDVEDASKTGAVIDSVGEVVTGAMKSTQTIQEIYNIWKPLAGKIQVVVDAVEVLSEIHPYVQMTLSVVSIPLKIVKGQRDKDGEVLDLLKAISDVYDLLRTAGLLTKLDAHRKTAKALFQQTTECAWFIREYFSRGFAGRILKSFTTNHDNIAQQYQTTFKQLRDAFSNESAINTEISVVRVLTMTEKMESELKNISMKQDFRDLPYATGQSEPEKCLSGTRANVIREITSWFNEPYEEQKRMFWLHGLAGCGKSTIARSVAELLEANGRCVSFYFNASNRSEAGPHNLFSTLSRDLADLNQGWKAALAKTIEGSMKARTSKTVTTQFNNLILEPARDFDSVGPILIIIDALDESGSVNEREPILETLKRLKELPGQFRFLVTSRDEIDIRNVLGKEDWIQLCQLDRVDTSSTDDDIRLYVRGKLMAIPELRERWDEEWVDQMVVRAGRLFQWAFTACKFIKGSGQAGHEPFEQLRLLLAPDRNTFRGLYDLYQLILDKCCSFERDDIIHRRFETIIGRILSLKEPLPLDSLDSLYYDEEDKEKARGILSAFGSLLHGVTGSGEPVQPLHASFIDFLLDKKWSGKYWVDIEKQKKKIPRALLREMQEGLRFNICELETSYKLNREIEDLNKRVKQYIPAHLAYACRFWGDHLSDAPTIDEEVPALDRLVHTNFLFWLEALGLLKKANIASTQLSKVQNWLTPKKDEYRTLSDFLAEAQLFILAFGGVVEQSVPHIYLSALAFVPRDSIISKTYTECFRDPIDTKFHEMIQWPTSLLHIDVQSEVSCVAFSPNGNRVVSSSPDSTVRIWNAHTGELVAGPFHGHDDAVRSVGFSPDGNRVVSGSRDKTVRIWNAHTGELVAGPFYGHDNYIYSVGFSPDGNRVVSGSSDSTVRIWNAHTGELVAGPFHGHDDAVSSVGFSPDGNRIVSGSWDSTVRIWNAHTGELVAGPFYGHDDGIESVGFSPDGNRVVSGSSDSTVRIWNAHTGELVAGPFHGHDHAVWSVGFSPDGNRVVSGSWDSTVRIWNAHTGELVAGPFHGHDYAILSVGFSPDGNRVVSGSQDSTVRIWNAHISELVAGPFHGHDDAVRSVGFSPDGNRVVSGSWDSTVRIWNAHTGELVAGPFHGQDNSVSSVGFSPDGNRVVSGSRDSTVKIWNAHTGKLVAGPFHGHDDAISSVGFSPDGNRIVSGSEDSTVRIWNAHTGELVAGPFHGHDHAVRSVGFSPDGNRVVSGSRDKTVRIWNAHTGELVAGPFHGHDNAILSVGFSPDGNRIVSGSWDKTVRIWDAHTGELVASPFHGHDDAFLSVGFSPDGNRIVSGSWDSTVRIWNAHTGELVAGPFYGHDDGIESVGFSPDGNRVVSGSSDSTVRIWNAHTGELVAGPFHGHDDSVESVGFSPDGNRVVSGSWDKTVRIWNAHTGELVAGPFHGQDNGVSSVGFSPDGNRVVSGSEDSTVKIWNAHTGELVAGPFHGHDDAVSSVGFSPDGNRIVSGSEDSTVRIWNAHTGKLVAGPFYGHDDAVRSVGFLPNGNCVVSGSWDKTVRIWNAHTGELVAGPFRGHNKGVESVGFSPDGNRVVSGSSDSTVRIWNAHTGELVAGLFHGHDNYIYSVGFSPDGNRVISGSSDSTVRIWNAHTGKLVAGPFHGHDNYILSVGFSPDGNRVVSGSSDSTVRIWNVHTGELVAGLFHGHDDAISPDGNCVISGPQNLTARIWNAQPTDIMPDSSYGRETNSFFAYTTLLPSSPRVMSNISETMVVFRSNNHSAALVYTDQSIFHNGWMYGPDDELLFWVPPEYRPNLWRSNNTAVIGRKSIRYNFAFIAHGTHWTENYERLT